MREAARAAGGRHHDCRDGVVGLAKTCFKLDIGFWDYLTAPLNVPGCQLIPPLLELILAKAPLALIASGFAPITIPLNKPLIHRGNRVTCVAIITNS